MDSDDASQGISAMIVFISIILVSSIISGVVIGFAEKVFTETKTDAKENVPSVKGIVNIVVLEIFSLGANDEIHIVFELPYIESAVADDDLAWVVMCNPSGSNNVNFDEGDFILATDLDGDGICDVDDSDADGDGYSDDGDAFDNDPYQWADNDGDGWSNDNDECPSLASVLGNGCPDSDGDGWVDDGIDGQIDDCPEEWGT